MKKKQNKNITWQEVYILPLHIHEYMPFSAFTKDGNRAFDFMWLPFADEPDAMFLDVETQVKIVNKINDKAVKGLPFKNFVYGQGFIYGHEITSGKKGKVLMLRGWGYLTGTGALNLPTETAAKIQDDFGEWICEQLNK